MVPYKIIFKEILSQKIRLILAIFSVAWGTASIAFMLSIGEGLRLSFMQTTSAGGNTTLAVQPFYTTINYQGTPKGAKVHFPEKYEHFFSTVPDVEAVAASKSFSATTRKEKITSYSSPIAVTPEYQKISSVDIKEGGRFINYLDINRSSKVAFLGYQVANTLFPKIENPVGMPFLLGDTVFHVIGVSKQSMGLSSFGSTSSMQVIIPLTTYKELTNDTESSQYLFYLKQGADTEAVKKDILQRVAMDQGFSPDDEEALSFSDSSDSAGTVNSFLFGFQVFLGIVGGMTLLVSGVGIANVMYMSITRATKIIGTQMAIGATYGAILFHYFLESMIITVFGGLVGVFSTVGLVELLDMIPIRNATYVKMGSPKPVLSWLVLTIVIGVLGIIGFFAAYFPARNAATISPADALRQEG